MSGTGHEERAAPVDGRAGSPRRERSPGAPGRPVPVKATWAQFTLAVAIPVAVAAALAATGDAPTYRPGVALLAAIVTVAALCGRRAAATAGALSLVLLWALTRPPGGSLTAGRGAEVAAQVLFAMCAIAVVAVMAGVEGTWARLAASERDQAEQREAALEDLVRVREAQSAADSRFRSLVAATTSVVFATDPAARFAEPQQEWEAYTGQAWPEHSGLGWAEMVHPSDRDRARAALLDALAAGRSFDEEVRLWHAPSRRHHVVVVRATPLRDGSGAVAEWIGTITDVQDRLELRADLERARRQVEVLFEADVLAVVSGEDERITTANDAFLDLVGHTRAELEAGALTWRTLTPPGWEEVDQEALRLLAVDGRAPAYEKEYLRPDGERVPVQVGVAALDQRPLRWVAFVADLRARRQAEHDLREALEERAFVARTLQASLLPTRLPEVPGLDLAARYLPAPEGEGIGGDFYDVFPDDDGRWHVVVGDVSGRGTEAAALTALCRHTLRAGGLQHSSPAQVLQLLNDAIRHSSDDDGRFCTVAYAVLDPVGDGWHMRLVLGGHHQPRLLRAGALHRVGWHGTLIGAFPTVRVVTQSLLLVPGDQLVIFTDGLIEQRRVGFAEPAFDRLLGQVAERGLDADALAGTVEREAGDTVDREDDMALVVLRVPGESPLPAPSPDAVVELEQDYPAEILSVRRARALAVRASGLAGEDAETVALLTSELASNAALHARTPFTVRVARAEGRVRVSVRDGDPSPPRLRDHGQDSVTGRGVRLVDELADGWGTTPVPGGKEVWFDVETAHRPPASAPLGAG